MSIFQPSFFRGKVTFRGSTTFDRSISKGTCQDISIPVLQDSFFNMRMLHEQKQAPWHGLGRGISTSNQKIQHQICQELIVQAWKNCWKKWRFHSQARDVSQPFVSAPRKAKIKKKKQPPWESFIRNLRVKVVPSNNKLGLEISFVTPCSSQVVQVAGLCSDRKNRVPVLFHFGMNDFNMNIFINMKQPWELFSEKKLNINHKVKKTDPRTVSDDFQDETSSTLTSFRPKKKKTSNHPEVCLVRPSWTNQRNYLLVAPSCQKSAQQKTEEEIHPSQVQKLVSLNLLEPSIWQKKDFNFCSSFCQNKV